ncbi:MAG: 4Fe-4S dicluster domain-containing protein [Syntrophorhabdaceae bacterium]|nr:4Fe-4S dicluster domain-containing protein [Syntrophorhabdaceae bacterium]MDD4196129.1 4Fe-4S dicluster domain-containing protein [Syntrophorhabdaceae bacterium]
MAKDYHNGLEDGRTAEKVDIISKKCENTNLMPERFFLSEMEEMTGIAVSECYQCFRCTNGCPAARDMDIVPHRIIGYIISGERECVLSSAGLWACLQCAACSIRCPNGIDVARIFTVLRRMSVESGLAAQTNIHEFDTLMVESIARHGHMYELGTVMRYRLSRRELLKSYRMGIGMIKKRRIGLFPHNVADRNNIRSIIKKTGGRGK